MIFHLGHDYATYAGILNRKSQNTQAGEYFGKAIQTFKECGADGWVQKYEKELDNFLSPL